MVMGVGEELRPPALKEHSPHAQLVIQLLAGSLDPMIRMYKL
jgi:hypothetical protein